MHPLIALWSHPRSMSTATERIMRERGDLVCFHEPFLYDYYLHRKVRHFPHFDPEPGRPVAYRDIRDHLLRAAEKGPVFFKDMSYYVMPHILSDEAFLDRLTNAFLIRDPRAALVSYHKLDPALTCEEVGLRAQADHLRGLLARGERPVVIRSEDVQADPEGAMSAFWREVDLDPRPEAFVWQRPPPSDWAHVEGWHGDVRASQGIRPPDPDAAERAAQAFEERAARFPHLRDYLEHHLPHYEFLAAHALKV